MCSRVQRTPRFVHMVRRIVTPITVSTVCYYYTRVSRASLFLPQKLGQKCVRYTRQNTANGRQRC